MIPDDVDEIEWKYRNKLYKCILIDKLMENMRAFPT